MEVFLTVVFFLVLFSYLFAKFLPYLLRWFISRKLKDLNKNGGTNGQYTYTNFGGNTRNTNTYSEQQKTKEGKVYVKTTDSEKTSKKVSNNIGEYVDYEDVK
ncbi:MAG: DUF4834 family protein [Rikenellaceae bacterium]